MAKGDIETYYDAEANAWRNRAVGGAHPLGSYTDKVAAVAAGCRLADIRLHNHIVRNSDGSIARVTYRRGQLQHPA